MQITCDLEPSVVDQPIIILEDMARGGGAAGAGRVGLPPAGSFPPPLSLYAGPVALLLDHSRKTGIGTKLTQAVEKLKTLTSGNDS